MKRLFLLLVIVMLFSITACSSSSTGGGLNNSENGIEGGTQDAIACTHVWKEATCTESRSCRKCNKVIGSALGHTTTSGICSRCGENFSKWKVGEYTDEFKQPTGKKYMSVDSYGTFSNSATTNSTLYAILQIDKDNIGIMMWEYGNYLLKGTFDYENYDITILDEKGTKYYFDGIIYKSGTRVYFDDSDREAVLQLLRNNNTLKIYLKSTKYSISTYLFTVETSGFTETYKSIK